MDHKEIEERLLTVDDETLNPAERSQLLAHLESCLSCQERHELWKRIKTDFLSLEQPQASREVFVQRIMSNIPDEAGAQLRNPLRWFFPALSLGMASVLVLLSFGQPDGEPLMEDLLYENGEQAESVVVAELIAL